MKSKNLITILFIFILFTVIIFSLGSHEEEWIKTELYFGLSVPGGGFVTDGEFIAFTDSVISPAFPEGFTVVNASGTWYDPDIRQTITENSKIVIRYSIMNEINSAAIDTMREKYKRYFSQQSVMRTDSRIKISF